MGQAAGPSAPRRDGGVALIVVIGIAAVLTLLVTAALSVSLGSVVKARTDQDWNGAIAAAYAGVDDYKSKLANDNTYMQYGNPDSPFSATSKAAGALALPMGSGTNPAFGIGQAGSWATVPGGGTASYRYEVDNSSYWSSGVLRLQATGRVGNQTRSIVVNLKQPGFIDFLYFSNYEVQDPDLTGMNGTNGQPNCAKYKWQGRDSRCAQIQFGSNDVINGPLHSNDTLYICGATFNGPVTTANTANPPRYDKPSSGCSAPNFTVPGSPAYATAVTMPPSNAQMKDETRTDIPALVPRPGCLYTGPTSIVFNADGTVTVRSPWTKVTRVVGNPATAAGTPPPGSSSCGTPGDPTKNAAGNAGTLAGASGQTFPVPAKNLIYVQSVPTSRTVDPNYWPASSTPPGLMCTGLTGSSGAGNGIGYPTMNEYAPTATSGTQAYSCRNGDAFVEGQLHGAVTISAANYLYVTRNITYLDPKVDVLGLVAENAIWVWNPMKCNSGCTGASNTPLLSDSVKDNGRTIDAAILSVNHTFQVQNYDKGNLRGNLTVSGAIAQNFRGPVGTGGSTGYTKNYLYDQRFRNIAPPKFLVPVSTTYGVSVQVEVGKAFNPDGSAG